MDKLKELWDVPAENIDFDSLTVKETVDEEDDQGWLPDIEVDLEQEEENELLIFEDAEEVDCEDEDDEEEVCEEDMFDANLNLLYKALKRKRTETPSGPSKRKN